MAIQLLAHNLLGIKIQKTSSSTTDTYIYIYIYNGKKQFNNRTRKRERHTELREEEGEHDKKRDEGNEATRKSPPIKILIDFWISIELL